MKTTFISEEEKRIPICASADVVVIGGGPAGVSAAIASSRSGAKTILIERYGVLGGLATGGLVIKLYGGSYKGELIVEGIYREIVSNLRKNNWADEDDEPTINPEGLMILLDQYMTKEHIHLLLHSLAVDATMNKEANKIESVIIECKAGRLAVTGRAFVDATGDGDTIRWCSLPHYIETKDNLKPITTIYRMGNVDIKQAETFKNSKEYPEKLKEWLKASFRPAWDPTLNIKEVWMDDIFMSGLNPLDVKDLTNAELLGRKKVWEMISHYRNKYPGFAEAHLINTAPILGIRDTRRITGQYTLTKNDVTNCARFEDTIALGVGPKGVFGIPFRCLIPQKINNLLFAGRCISVEHGVLDYVRVIAQCIATGEAAGKAASTMAKEGLNR